MKRITTRIATLFLVATLAACLMFASAAAEKVIVPYLVTEDMTLFNGKVPENTLLVFSGEQSVIEVLSPSTNGWGGLEYREGEMEWPSSIFRQFWRTGSDMYLEVTSSSSNIRVASISVPGDRNDYEALASNRNKVDKIYLHFDSKISQERALFLLTGDPGEFEETWITMDQALAGGAESFSCRFLSIDEAIAEVMGTL